MQAKRSTDKYIKEAIRKQVYVPCNDMKSDVSKKNMPAAGALDDESRAQLNTFLSCYPENYTFKKDSIYYDVINKTLPTAGSKLETWGKVIYLNKKAFKHQEFNKTVQFQGTLETDDVGVTKVDDDQTKYIEELTQPLLKSSEGKCVLIDPGRRDIIKTTLPLIVKEAEAALSKTESKSVQLEKFKLYITARALVKNTLYAYYGNETQKPEEVYFPDSRFDFRLDENCNLYYGNLFVVRIRSFSPQPEQESTEGFETNDIQKINAVLEKLQVLPFRKLKFSSKLFSIKTITLWSATYKTNLFHEPTRNKGLIEMLKKNGFTMYLINEYKTSSICPNYEHTLETFKTVPDPRPYRQTAMSKVTCHGLIR
ncbi:hypothetical protein EDC94DRAFT_666624 [Helicostylum pulchrum]|nr:hypothetical protein EDC94DRAFT_666624 [Helicostylum pulchrum]